jgi:hypothetical protein
MRLKFNTKYGIQIVNKEDFNPLECGPSEPIYRSVEDYFNDWIENTNPASEYEEKYFGDDAIYTVNGAILGGIEAIVEYMVENGITSISERDFHKIDIEGAAFEG